MFLLEYNGAQFRENIVLTSIVHSLARAYRSLRHDMGSVKTPAGHEIEGNVIAFASDQPNCIRYGDRIPFFGSFIINNVINAMPLPEGPEPHVFRIGDEGGIYHCENGKEE